MSDKSEKRAARVKPLELKEILFSRNDIDTSTLYSISNLSETGLGVRRKPADYWPIKDYIDGELILEDSKIPVTIRVMRITASEAGCAIIKGSSQLKRILHLKYHTEMNAHGLKKVDETLLRQQPDGKPHWHFDGSGGELYFIEKDNEIVRYRLTCDGISAEGSKGHPLRITRLVDDEIVSVPLDERISKVILKFLNNIDNLDPGYLHRFFEIFEPSNQKE